MFYISSLGVAFIYFEPVKSDTKESHHGNVNF